MGLTCCCCPLPWAVSPSPSSLCSGDPSSHARCFLGCPSFPRFPKGMRSRSLATEAGGRTIWGATKQSWEKSLGKGRGWGGAALPRLRGAASPARPGEVAAGWTCGASSARAGLSPRPQGCSPQGWMDAQGRMDHMPRGPRCESSRSWERLTQA